MKKVKPSAPKKPTPPTPPEPQLTAEQLRTLEYLRLEDLVNRLNVILDRARSPQIQLQAIDLLRQVIDAECALLGLNAPEKVEITYKFDGGGEPASMAEANGKARGGGK